MQITDIGYEDANPARDWEAEIQALLNPAKRMLFLNAIAGNERPVVWAQAAIKTLNSLKDGVGTRAAKHHQSIGGYFVPAEHEAVWAKLPVGVENFTLRQVQEFLRAHGIQIATDAVANHQVNAVEQLKDHMVAAIDSHNEHDTARADVSDGACDHGESPVVAGVDIVDEGGAA